MFYVHPSKNPPKRPGPDVVNWGVWCYPRHDSNSQPICVQEGYTTRAEAQAEAERLNSG